MKVISNAKWQSGSELLSSPPKHKTTAILAIKDNEKGTYFILPEIFSFDKHKKTFVGEQHGKPQTTDYWYMLENELLFPFESESVYPAKFA